MARPVAIRNDNDTVIFRNFSSGRAKRSRSRIPVECSGYSGSRTFPQSFFHSEIQMAGKERLREFYNADATVWCIDPGCFAVKIRLIFLLL